jgi:hypothetical protein
LRPGRDCGTRRFGMGERRRCSCRSARIAWLALNTHGVWSAGHLLPGAFVCLAGCAEGDFLVAGGIFSHPP